MSPVKYERLHPTSVSRPKQRQNVFTGQLPLDTPFRLFRRNLYSILDQAFPRIFDPRVPIRVRDRLICWTCVAWPLQKEQVALRLVGRPFDLDRGHNEYLVHCR